MITPQKRLDIILNDMAQSGSEPRRAAKRIRAAVDALLIAVADPPVPLPVAHHVDVPPVTEAMAEALVCHHLALAAAYYEAAGDGLELALVRARHGASGAVELSLSAERAWLRELDRAYDRVDEGEDA